jgi:hypothetical protein
VNRAVRVGFAVLALGWALASFALPRQPAESVPAQQAESVAAAAPALPPTPPPAPLGSTARVTFQFEQSGALVPRFTLAIDEGGKIVYTAEQALEPGGREGNIPTPSTQHVEQRAVLSRATTARIFQLARSADRFHVPCASLVKNIADLGKKTLSYAGAEGDGSCVYNFSQNKSVAALTDLLQAIVFTLDTGRKLEFDHRFDRLGLDQDTELLTAAAADGRAVEVGMIARTLRSIAEDSEVLQRVRGRASTLLQRFPPAE